MLKEMNIVLVGVGGQGTLLASRVLGKLAVNLGMDVKLSEVHGMAQRGGSVVSYVRIGHEVNSPRVEGCGADYVLAFEALEAARARNYLKSGGVLVVNTQKIAPMPVITGAAKYPEDPLDGIEGVRVVKMDALALATQAGAAKAVNLVLLGALYALEGGEDREAWLGAIAECVPPKYMAANLMAFEFGAKAVAE